MRELTPFLALGAAKPFNLIKCPDCSKDSSRRAVHCPDLRCFGEAISVEGKRIGDTRILKSLVVSTVPHGGRFRVAVKKGRRGFHFCSNAFNELTEEYW